MFKNFSFHSVPKQNPSSKERVKRLHHECYEIISEAIKLDEQTFCINEKNKVLELYKQGLRKLDKALAIKFDPHDPLDEKSKTLIEKMKGNRAKVLERLQDLDEKIKATKSTSRSNTLNGTNSLKVTPTRNRPQISAQYRRQTSLPSDSTAKGDDLKNDTINGEPNKNLSTSTSMNLSNFKNIDKKILDMIIDNVYKPSSSITFDTISGLHSAKQALKEIVIWPMLNPELFTGLRQPSRGILFFGPPGCGKTLLAKAIANECKANFLSITASSLTSKWVGESEKLVKALFAVARQLKPCILFIDEIDSLLSERKDNESEATRRLKTEFFIELDGFRTDDNDQVFVLAATNVPYSLDEAALRRFPKRIFINLPDLNGRRELFAKLLSQQANQLSSSDIIKLAEQTEGYSASDLHALCRDAALQPLREIETDKIKNLKPKNIRKINYKDFDGSLKRIRKSCVDSTIERLKKWSSQYGDNSEQN